MENWSFIFFFSKARRRLGFRLNLLCLVDVWVWWVAEVEEGLPCSIVVSGVSQYSSNALHVAHRASSNSFTSASLHSNFSISELLADLNFVRVVTKNLGVHQFKICSEIMNHYQQSIKYLRSRIKLKRISKAIYRYQYDSELIQIQSCKTRRKVRAKP